MIYDKFIQILSRYRCEECIDCEVFIDGNFFVIVSQGIEIDRFEVD